MDIALVIIAIVASVGVGAIPFVLEVVQRHLEESVGQQNADRH